MEAQKMIATVSEPVGKHWKLGAFLQHILTISVQQELKIALTEEQPLEESFSRICNQESFYRKMQAPKLKVNFSPCKGPIKTFSGGQAEFLNKLHRNLTHDLYLSFQWWFGKVDSLIQ